MKSRRCRSHFLVCSSCHFSIFLRPPFFLVHFPFRKFGDAYLQSCKSIQGKCLSNTTTTLSFCLKPLNNPSRATHLILTTSTSPPPNLGGPNNLYLNSSNARALRLLLYNFSWHLALSLQVPNGRSSWRGSLSLLWDWPFRNFKLHPLPEAELSPANQHSTCLQVKLKGP